MKEIIIQNNLRKEVVKLLIFLLLNYEEIFNLDFICKKFDLNYQRKEIIEDDNLNSIWNLCVFYENF